MKNCYNKGNIVGESMIGGIVGGCDNNSKVINCYNTGKIISNGTQTYRGASGIVGQIYGNGEIYGCYNNGIIEGTNCGTGGIVGEIYTAADLQSKSRIVNCYNNGNISNKDRNAGGIIGFISLNSRGDLLNLNIENCYNLANVNSTQASGGMIGYALRVYETASIIISVNNCYNIGEIKGNVMGEMLGRTYKINQEDFKVSNSYYIEKRNNAIGQGNATETNVESKSQQYMKTNEFVELLNSNIDSTNTEWKKWKLGTNGYPTFID